MRQPSTQLAWNKEVAATYSEKGGFTCIPSKDICTDASDRQNKIEQIPISPSKPLCVSIFHFSAGFRPFNALLLLRRPNDTHTPIHRCAGFSWNEKWNKFQRCWLRAFGHLNWTSLFYITISLRQRAVLIIALNIFLLQVSRKKWSHSFAPARSHFSQFIFIHLINLFFRSSTENMHSRGSRCPLMVARAEHSLCFQIYLQLFDRFRLLFSFLFFQSRPFDTSWNADAADLFSISMMRRKREWILKTVNFQTDSRRNPQVKMGKWDKVKCHPVINSCSQYINITRTHAPWPKTADRWICFFFYTAQTLEHWMSSF